MRAQGGREVDERKLEARSWSRGSTTRCWWGRDGWKLMGVKDDDGRMIERAGKGRECCWCPVCCVLASLCAAMSERGRTERRQTMRNDGAITQTTRVLSISKLLFAVQTKTKTTYSSAVSFSPGREENGRRGREEEREERESTSERRSSCSTTTTTTEGGREGGVGTLIRPSARSITNRLPSGSIKPYGPSRCAVWSLFVPLNFLFIDLGSRRSRPSMCCLLLSTSPHQPRQRTRVDPTKRGETRKETKQPSEA